jgi:predicted nuclease with TOPRIM domain
MKCNRLCDKKKKHKSSQSRLKQKLEGLDPALAQKDLQSFMNQMKEINLDEADIAKHRNAIMTCEGTKDCK